MSSPRRMLAVLDLFTAEHPIWATEDAITELGYARATGYRYFKDLVDAGLLQKVSAGKYALGGRIIELDYQLRQTDPMRLSALPFMDQLALDTGFDVVLSVLFSGPRVVDTYRVRGNQNLDLSHARGRPRPVFRSASPKILLAHLPRAQLVKIYASHGREIADNGLGGDWAEFRSNLTAIRRRGVYVSAGELDAGIGAVAVPVMNQDGETLAALAVVGRQAEVSAFGEEKLFEMLSQVKSKTEASLAAAYTPA